MSTRIQPSMSPPPNTERIAATCGVYIDDFQSLFKFHKVKTGAPEFFIDLGSILGSKQSLRSDFFRLANSIRQKEGGTFSDADMLTVVALALGGPEVGGRRGEVTIPLNVLTAYTTGIADWEQTGGRPPAVIPDFGSPAGFAEPAQLSSQGAGGMPVSSGRGLGIGSSSEVSLEERLALRQEAFARRSTHGPHGNGKEPRGRLRTEEDFGPYPRNGDNGEMGEGPDELPARLAPKISGTLERLELDSNELRLHLLDLERRLSQMEPYLERGAAVSKPSADPVAPEPVAAKAEAGLPAPQVGEVRQVTQAPLPPVIVAAAAPVGELDGLARADKAEFGFSRAAEHRFSAASDAAHPGALPKADEIAVPGPPIPAAAIPVAALRETAVPSAATLAKAGASERDEEIAEKTVPAVVRPAANPDVRRLRYAVIALGALLALVMAFGGVFAYRFYSLQAAQQRSADSSTGGKRTVAGGLEPAAGVGGKPSAAVETAGAPVTGQIPGEPQRALPNAGKNNLPKNDGLTRFPGPPVPATGGAPAVEQAGTAANSQTGTAAGLQPGGTSNGARGESAQPAAANGTPPPPQSVQQAGAPSAAELQARAEPSTVARETTAAPVPTVTERSATPAPAEAGAGARAASGATNSSPTSGPSGPISVPSAVMMRNATLVRKPDYPVSARSYSIQGTVVVETLISKNGMVESARAISGPSILRPSAIDAIHSWRFKPYLVDGKPVQVNTYVNFVFTLR